MFDADAILANLQRTKGKLACKIQNAKDLQLCHHFAVLNRPETRSQILTLPDPPRIKLSERLATAPLQQEKAEQRDSITMKIDARAAMTMQAFLRKELLSRASFVDYDVCDVGFWDLNVAKDRGFPWHNDNNWNSYLGPDNKTYHGWFVYSCTGDCNSTLAVSTDCRFNECNTNVVLGISDIKDNDVIKPDVIAPLQKNSLVLFPVGSAHRTYRFKEPGKLVGNRICVAFILYHKGDKLNEDKLAQMTDTELAQVFERYGMERAFETGHYMIDLVGEHPRLQWLMKTIDSSAGW